MSKPRYPKIVNRSKVFKRYLKVQGIKMYLKVQGIQKVPKGPRYQKGTLRSRLLGGTSKHTDTQTDTSTP